MISLQYVVWKINAMVVTLSLPFSWALYFIWLFLLWYQMISLKRHSMERRLLTQKIQPARWPPRRRKLWTTRATTTKPSPSLITCPVKIRGTAAGLKLRRVDSFYVDSQREQNNDDDGLTSRFVIKCFFCPGLSGTADQPGPRRDGWTRRPSASLSDTVGEEGVSGAAATWGLAEAGDDPPAAVPSGPPAVPPQVSGVDTGAAEEAGIFPTLNTG